MQNPSPQSMLNDELPLVLGYLSFREILLARVCKRWKEAAAQTLVPPSTTIVQKYIRYSSPDVAITDARAYNALKWLVVALPKLQQLSLEQCLDQQFLIQSGEDPMDVVVNTPDYSSNEPSSLIEKLNRQTILRRMLGRRDMAPLNANPIGFDTTIVSQFRSLKTLKIKYLKLNGVYTKLFHFPQLQALHITNPGLLKWDLQMLAGLPVLEELRSKESYGLRGNLKDLRLVRNTLKSIEITSSNPAWRVVGDFMELADFPLLEKVCLTNTGVTGSMLDIKPVDFPKIRYLELPEGVFGARFVDRIAEVSEVMRIKCNLQKRSGALMGPCFLSLSRGSPDEYRMIGNEKFQAPPFKVQIVKAGPRIGWRWTNFARGGSCEINWFETALNIDGEEYETYKHEVQKYNSDVYFYSGFYDPPSENEYQALVMSSI